MKKWLTIVLLSMALAACAEPTNAPTLQRDANPAAPSTRSAPDGHPDARGQQLLVRASRFIANKQPVNALPLTEEAIAYYEQTYRKPGQTPYSARWLGEAMVYAAQSASTPAAGEARIYGEAWGAAYYFKGYALVDLQRVADAKAAFDAAIALAPRNSKYLAERANIDALQRNWPASLENFRRALDAAESSAPELKTQETMRALRGMAFAQIELKDLDDAQALHKRVLQLNPGDAISLEELRNIQTLRRRSPLQALKVTAPMPMPAPMLVPVRENAAHRRCREPIGISGFVSPARTTFVR